MVDKELVSFIRESINQGHSLDVIKPVLREKGWNDGDIGKAFEKATQNQLILSASISFVLFIILTSVFVFSLVFSQSQITAAAIGSNININQDVAGVSLAFILYIILASLIWLRMLYSFINRRNRL